MIEIVICIGLAAAVILNVITLATIFNYNHKKKIHEKALLRDEMRRISNGV